MCVIANETENESEEGSGSIRLPTGINRYRSIISFSKEFRDPFHHPRSQSVDAFVYIE